MAKGTVTLGFLVLALAGCRGTASSLPEDFVSFSFGAKLVLNPLVPQVNKRVSLNLEVTSASTEAVKTDIFLKVVSEQGEVMYEAVWNEVLFHEHEVWNLTQGFLPDSDAGRKPWKVKLLVKNRANNLPLFDESIATLDFKKV